jgi:hypothetical protein
MDNCIYCSARLSDKGVFCPQCAKQSKCKSCGNLLEINAKACVVCGTLISEGNSNSAKQTSQTDFDNIFELNETTEFDGGKSSRNMRLGCSNEAVSNFADFVEKRIKGTQVVGNVRIEKNAYLPPLNVLPSVENIENEYTQEINESTAVTNTENNYHLSEKEALHKIFRKDGNVWKLDEIQLKANNKLDYARRLTFLFLYLNDLEGNSKTSRSVLNSILEDSTVYDGNTRRWLANEPSISKDGDTLELNAGGRRQAQDCLKNLSNNTIVKPWLPGSTIKRTSKISTEKIVKESSNKRSGKRNPKTSEIVEKWKSLGLNVDGHKVFASRTNLDKGLLGLWAIRRAMGDDVKVVSSAQIEKFLFDAFELKIHKRTLENTFTTDEAKGKVTKVSGTSFQILPPGNEHIENIFNL